jgi:glucan 1,4-alpha-glucosidase
VSNSMQSGKKESNKTNIASPSGNITVQFFLTENKQPAYQVFFNNKKAIDTSILGFELKDQPALKEDFKIISTSTNSKNETWEMPWGEQKQVVNNYNEFIVALQEENGLQRQLNITFRVYDDGLGFRYTFPKQSNLNEVIIAQENTQFKLTGDHQSWWTPGDWDSYEHVYNATRISKINAPSKGDPTLSFTSIPENSVHTPFTMKTDGGLYLSIHEANLTDYASMTLLADTANLSLSSALVKSDRYGYAVKRTAPFDTPWRTIQVADKAGALIESKLVLNLNEPNKLEDVSFIQPMKYNGIWWEMHLDKAGWDMEGGRHGATTANTKRYIDFAAANNLKGVLVEGWNTGWDRWTNPTKRENAFDFTTPYADYDLAEVVRYAKSKGVEMIMHHETSASPLNYEKHIDAAYQLMNKHGIRTAKLGYVGKLIPDGEHHYGQWMVNHHRRVLEKSAKYKIAINVHEPIKPTGLRRTYPNLISGEGVRGQEFNAWSADGGNPTDHLTIVPFTRMLAGPIDYTPGIFNLKLGGLKPNNSVKTTLAQQLALYVIIYSPVQMAADLPEFYKGIDAFQFIKEVGVDWDKTVVLDGEIGDHVSIARKEKETGNWFVGAITDENPRDITIDFGFLEAGKKYKAKVYKDGPNAHWDKNPTDYLIEEITVDNSSKQTYKLAAGGGVAISIMAGK